jgi:hypothetical protein
MNIKEAFQREFERKRKGLASSPGEQDKESTQPVKRQTEVAVT